MAARNPLEWFRAKARPVRNIMDDPAKYGLKIFGSNWTTGITYNEAIAAKQAMTHPVVGRCIHKIGLALQDVDWYVEQDPNSKDKVTKAQLKAYQDVLDYPNDDMSAAQLRYWLGINKAIYGRFALKIGAMAKGGPNAIYSLSQTRFKTFYKPNGLVDYFQYGDDTSNEKLPTRRSVDAQFNGAFTKAFGYEYVQPDLEGLYGSSTVGARKNNTPLNAIGLPSSIITSLLQRAIDTASGHPNTKYIISGEKTLTSEEQDAIADDIDERKVGAEESGNILFLANTSIKIDELDNGMDDIHSKIPMDDMSRMIYSNFGIPVALAGIGSSDAAKFAGNYESSRRSFYEDTIIPNYLGPVASGLTFAMCPPGMRVMFDEDSIAGLADARANKAKTLMGVMFLTDAEKRVLCGFPPNAEKYNDVGSKNQTTSPPSGQSSGTEVPLSDT